MPSRRPPPPLFPPLPLDPISDNLPSDIISRDSSSSDSDTETTAKRGRMLKYAESYLRGEPLYLHSAGLRGPVVKNPWAKGRKQAKRKATEIEEESWGKDLSKRLKRGKEDIERGVELAPPQVGGNAMSMWSRGTNTTWDGSSPSTPTPLRVRPPEATNLPDRSHSRSHSPFDKDSLEFRTPTKKKLKAPIEVAPVFSPGTFYRPKPKPQQISIEDASSQRRSPSAKKSSPLLESDCSASKSSSLRKTRKDPLEARDSTPRLRPRKKSPAEITPDTPTQSRDTITRLRPGRKPTTEPILEAPLQSQDSGSRPRSTRSSTRASEPELELLRESRSTPKQIITRAKTKSSESSEEARSNSKHGSTENSSKSMGTMEIHSPRQKQEQILDTIEVVPPPGVQSGDIDMRKKRPKIDFGALSPFGIAPERPKVRRRQRGGGPGKKGKKSADAQTEEQEVPGNMDIRKSAELKVFQPDEDADAMTYVPGPENGPEMVEIMNKEINPGLVDTRVAAMTEPNHPCGNVEAISEESSVILAASKPEQEQVTEASPSGRDPIEEAVLETWVNRHVAASQKFTADHNRISIANLLSPAEESPVARRNTSRRLEHFVPDTPINGDEVAVLRYGPINLRPVKASTDIPALLPPTSQVEKAQSPITSHTATIDVPRSPDQLSRSAQRDTHQKSSTQFDTTNPISGTEPENQHESWQNTQHAVTAAQKGFFEAIQESPDPLGCYPSTITPRRDLLRPIGFFEDENQSETPVNAGQFGNGYTIGENSPFKTPGMENAQWTVEPDESLLETSGVKNFRWAAKPRDGEVRGKTLLETPNLRWNDQPYEAEEGAVLKTPWLGQWTAEPRPEDREESPPKTPPSRQLSPLRLSFGSEESGSAFTPFHAFATPESSPKTNRRGGFPPNEFITPDVSSTFKKSVKFAQGLFGNDENGERGQNYDTITSNNDFSPVLGVEPQGNDSLLEQVKDFMGEGVWDTVVEAQKIAGIDSVSATPNEKGEKKEYMSARKRRALSKKKI